MKTSEDYFLNCHSEESVKIRFKKLSIKLHPDKNKNSPDATAAFQEMKDQRDEAIKAIYKKTGVSDRDIEIKLRDFVKDLDKMDFKKLNNVSKSIGEKFVEENPDVEPNFTNMFPYVLKQLFGAEKKNKLKGPGPGEQKKLS